MNTGGPGPLMVTWPGVLKVFTRGLMMVQDFVNEETICCLVGVITPLAL